MVDPSDTSLSFMTSPNKRFNFDIDLSEHSDHTDQSTAESLHSENVKLNRTIASIDQTEIDQDVVDHKLGSIERREPDKRKSHTLPSQGSTSHERTLTESRTVDILRDCSVYERPRMHMDRFVKMNSFDHTQEGRVRNTSESSTSGVSSCDSFLGKHALP